MENIKVLRKQEIDTNEIQVGDQILISLRELGDFTATAHKITDKGVLFIFDDYVTKKEINEVCTKSGSFEESDLKKWIDSELLEAFPAELKDRITGLTIPTVGELFGYKDELEIGDFEPDDDEQFPLMKVRKNRVAYLEDKCQWGWLRNEMKKEFSMSHFAAVNSIGDIDCTFSTNVLGVRPEFWLINESLSKMSSFDNV